MGIYLIAWKTITISKFKENLLLIYSSLGFFLISKKYRRRRRRQWCGAVISMICVVPDRVTAYRLSGCIPSGRGRRRHVVRTSARCSAKIGNWYRFQRDDKFWERKREVIAHQIDPNSSLQNLPTSRSAQIADSENCSWARLGAVGAGPWVWKCEIPAFLSILKIYYLAGGGPVGRLIGARTGVVSREKSWKF